MTGLSRSFGAALVLFAACALGAEPKLNVRHETSFVVFPQDANANAPMLFGGKVLAEMDRCAAVAVRRLLYASEAKDAVTVGIDKLAFHKGGEVKDLIFLTAEIVSLGKKTIQVYVKVEKESAEDRTLLADGYFTFCAFDRNQKKAIEHGLCLPKR